MKQHFRYFFDNGFGLIPTASSKEARERLIQCMAPGRRSTFYEALRGGIRDIRMPLYEEITSIVMSYGVTQDKIWRKEAE